MKLFQILIGEALEALSLDELATYRDALRATAEKVYAKDAETIGDLTPADLLEEMKAGVAGIEAANERIATLNAEAEATAASDPAEFDAELEALAVQARGELAAEGEPEDTPDEPEAEAAEEPAEPVAEEPQAVEPEAPAEPEAQEAPEPAEPVLASAKPTPLPRPARSAAAKPAERKPERVALTASCEGIGFAIGEEIPDEFALAAAMIEKRSRFSNMTAREDVPIARLDWRDKYAEEQHLSPDDGAAVTAAKINALLASLASAPGKEAYEALVAAGGICAPLTPYYDYEMYSVADRPVRAALPAFLADRGGINFGAPPALTAIDDAIGIITADEDALGGTSATKTCQVIECPDFSEVAVEILYHCLQTSNLPARTHPELLAHYNKLLLAAFARMAETSLLDKMKTASTHVTAASRGYGATGDILGQVLAAAAGMRSRHRMNPDAVLRMLMPRWATALLVSDVIRSQFQRFDTDEQRITALLRTFNIAPSFHLDGASGDGQIFGSQAATALLPFPTTVDWMLYPEGSFLFLDGGVLELGLVRDSVLNSTNEFQLFGESFESVAFLGVESLYVTSTVCDSGVVAAPAAISDCNYS